MTETPAEGKRQPGAQGQGLCRWPRPPRSQGASASGQQTPLTPTRTLSRANSAARLDMKAAKTVRPSNVQFRNTPIPTRHRGVQFRNTPTLHMALGRAIQEDPTSPHSTRVCNSETPQLSTWHWGVQFRNTPLPHTALLVNEGGYRRRCSFYQNRGEMEASVQEPRGLRFLWHQGGQSPSEASPGAVKAKPHPGPSTGREHFPRWSPSKR